MSPVNFTAKVSRMFSACSTKFHSQLFFAFFWTNILSTGVISSWFHSTLTSTSFAATSEMPRMTSYLTSSHIWYLPSFVM